MAGVRLAPLRCWSDFCPGSERFSRPDLRDLPRWNHRVTQNLLYYQTNYLLVALLGFLLVGFLNPAGMFTGVFVLVSVFLGSLWVGENKAAVRTFKQENPALFLVLVLLAGCLLLSLLGGLMLLLMGLKLPLLLIFAHASLRLRNMKNKLENKMESTGLRRTPMGILLVALGQQEENISRIQEFLETKLKE